jgi:L-asparaginase
MAESAYYLDLVRTDGPPVVFTGAQRRPDQPGADEPANLLAAVNAAEEPALEAAGGVYILLNGELHAARDVVKAHSWRLDAFASPGKGPVATIGPTGFEPYRDLGSRSATIPIDNPPSGRVEIVSTGIGMNGHSIKCIVEDGCEGFVLRATGLGNAPEPVAAAAGDALDAGVPVVVATRCYSGGVAPVYGGGGGHTLREHGAVFADDLSASKARIKLLIALQAGLDPGDAFATD